MRQPRSTVVNALSVDVEEYYHATIFREATRGTCPEGFESRVELSVERTLQLLGTEGVLATFFVLGEVAEEHPEMVIRIAAAGHEIACHGYCHELVSRQGPREFRDDVHRARELLEDLTGRPVIGYRAPSFSIGRQQEWAFDILLDEGFQYDSSIYPIFHDLYGHPRAPRFPHEIRRNGDKRLVEFPIGTARLLGINLPIGGGGYFRLLPWPWIRRGIESVNVREHEPIVFYFHPWELDPEQPRPPMPRHLSFRLRVGLDRTENKLSSLLRHIPFSTIATALGITPSARALDTSAAQAS